MSGRSIMARGTLIALAMVAVMAAPALAGQLKAGVATVDASWHVGASAGQYASTADPTNEAEFDPSAHSIKNRPSYGVQSRLDVRALVVEGPDGRRVALVKTDLYIPQDLLWRRAAQILASKHIGIGLQNLTMTITHDHSSPYYSSTSPGVWTFQDVFDVRFYDYYAQRIAQAVERAAAHLRRVRVGATVSYLDKPQRNALGPTVADDGTPAGFPNAYTDHELIVVRFDDVSGPRPKPLATLVDYELHGEGLSGNDLISSDFIRPLERMVDRRSGSTLIYVQNAVGTTEPERSPDYHNVHQRFDFPHKEYGQNEYEASLIARAVLGDWRDIGAGRPNPDPRYRDRFVPFTTSGPVRMEDHFFPGPVSHPYPSVSSCRTDSGLGGDPRIPVVGLPDCQDFSNSASAAANFLGIPFSYTIPTYDPGLTTDDFESRGIPVPENLSAPSYVGLEEDIGVHLQAFRVGPILFTVCSCEQWADQSKNIKTRTNTKRGDEFLGYDWSKLCRHKGDGTYRRDGTGTGHWICQNPQNFSTDPPPPANRFLPPLSDRLIEHMRAQVLNPANGWNDVSYAPYAESEPTILARIKGNYTHDDTSANAGYGYRLTVPISMANDYNGYIATYREYQRGDHYRKALTGWGPHSSDYMATRLVGMGRHLNGGPPLAPEPLSAKETADVALNDAKAQALGNAGAADIRAYEATLPDDGGTPGPLTEPRDLERFSAAFFSWLGGSNFTDNPLVRVQRRLGGTWRPFADQSGELPVTLKFPAVHDAVPYLLGNQRWQWTATFEAFVSRYDLLSGARATPAGEYRFVVDGQRRHGHRVVPYHIVSRRFLVRPWSGIAVEDLRVARDGTVSYRVGPRTRMAIAEPGYPKANAVIGPIDYPDSYTSPVRFIADQRSYIRDPASPADPRRFEWYCNTCSFRPWLDSADARMGYVTVVARNGARVRVAAVERGDRWYARQALCAGGRAFVAPGDVRDAWRDLNGRASASVRTSRRTCSRAGGGGRRRGAGGGRRRHHAPRFTG